MELLHHLETQLERPIPAQLQAALQQARDDYQPLCNQCDLAMHRHHTIAMPAPLLRATAKWVGCVKSTVCQWLRKVPLAVPQLPDGVLEMDGLWTRTRRGRTELKVIRAAGGTALGAFGPWATEHNLLALLPEQGLSNQTT